ncbi:MAG: YlmC/YmxH family sporulation protein [Clostridia bacterium]|nr:YlmC/YmxH family sporulation protein [Clostridia bacterium]
MKFCCLTELFKKELICIEDGRKLGYPTDVQIDCRCGQIVNLIVPAKGTFSFFGGKDCIKIPWCDVERIGEDVIWVCGCHDGKDKDCDRHKKRDDDCCC